MPTYQYACTECGEKLEVVQKFSDEPLTVCPSCQGRLRKVFSAVGVVFKGSGFYKTDSRSKTSAGSGSGSGGSSEPGTSGGSSESGTSGGSSDSGGSSGDAKPATPAPSTSTPSGDGSKVA